MLVTVNCWEKGQPKPLPPHRLQIHLWAFKALAHRRVWKHLLPDGRWTQCLGALSMSSFPSQRLCLHQSPGSGHPTLPVYRLPFSQLCPAACVTLDGF